MVEMDDRRAGIRFVFDHHVDLEFGKLVFFLFVHPRQKGGKRVAFFRRRGVFLGQEFVDIADDVVLNVFQKLNGLAMAFVFLPQAVDRIFYRQFNEFFAQKAAFAALTVFPFGQILGRFFDFFLHQVEVVDQFLFFVFRQFVKSFWT